MNPKIAYLVFDDRGFVRAFTDIIEAFKYQSENGVTYIVHAEMLETP